MSTTTELSFAERVAAFARSQGYSPYEGPDLGGSPMRQREELVGQHRPDGEDCFGDWVYPGRTVIEVPGRTWPITRPEDCTAELGTALWFDASGEVVSNVLDPDAPEAVVLLCSLCGLDCT